MRGEDENGDRDTKMRLLIRGPRRGDAVSARNGLEICVRMACLDVGFRWNKDGFQGRDD